MSLYYVSKNGKQLGPYSAQEICARIEEGVFSGEDLCWQEGMAGWLSIAGTVDGVPGIHVPPSLLVAPPPGFGGDAEPLFLNISTTRLIVLSIASFSLYEAYWVYKNWQYVKKRDGLDISPFWRGWFGYFFCHSLLRRIHEDKEANAVEVPSFNPSGLATGWVVLMILSAIIGRIPSLYAGALAAFVPSFLCLVPVQKYVNSVNKKRNPNVKPHEWSAGHIVCIVWGIVIWSLFLIAIGAELKG